MPGKKMDTVTVTIAGMINDHRYHACLDLAAKLADEYASVTVKSTGFLEVDWTEYIKEKAKELGGAAYDHRTSPLVYCNGSTYIGSEDEFKTWCKSKYRVSTSSSTVLYKNRARRAYLDWLQDSRMQYCYFDIKQGSKDMGRVIFELNVPECPKTCANFLALCTGDKGKSKNGTALNYKGTVLHRVVPGGWVQGGDICGGRGDDGESIYGRTFADENFAVKHDRPGVLAMATSKRHGNNSQFYVAMKALPWLDCKRVAFGRVVSGMRTMRMVEQVTCNNQRPVTDVVIADCGTVLADGKAAPRLSRAELESKDTRKRGTKIAQLKDVFSIADSNGTARVRHSELTMSLQAPQGPLMKHFPVQGAKLIVAVNEYCGQLQLIAPPRSMISRDEFIDVCMEVLGGGESKEGKSGGK